MNETINFLDNCDKEEFINFAKEFNVYKTSKNEEYLTIKIKIYELLPKFNLSIADIMPLPRVLGGEVQTYKTNTRINKI